VRAGRRRTAQKRCRKSSSGVSAIQAVRNEKNLTTAPNFAGASTEQRAQRIENRRKYRQQQSSSVIAKTVASSKGAKNKQKKEVTVETE
jgi:hypothetical protein